MGSSWGATATRSWGRRSIVPSPASCAGHPSPSLKPPTAIYKVPRRITDYWPIQAAEHFPILGIALRCDDVRWRGHQTTHWLVPGRLRGFAQALGADPTSPESFIGKHGRFVFDIYGSPRYGLVSSIAWGRSGSNLYVGYLEALEREDPELVQAIERSPGVLPLDDEPIASTSVYR